MTTSNVSSSVLSVASKLVYVDVDGLVILDRDASKAAFIAAMDLAETKRTTGASRIREAIAKAFADHEKGSAPIGDIVDAAAFLLNVGEGVSHATFKAWQNDVQEFIDENAASEKQGDSLAGKLYLKGAGRSGLMLITDKLLADRALASHKAAEVAAKKAAKAGLA